jgi:hypothetical protein
MITFEDGEISVDRFYSASGGFVQSKLDGSVVTIDDSTFVVISGDNTQDVFKTVDNVFSGLQFSAASGVVEIYDIINVSGLASDNVGDLAVVSFPDGIGSTAGFQLTLGAQPVSPVVVRMLCTVRGSGTGDADFNMQYNLFNQNTNADLTPGSFSYNSAQTLTIGSNSLEQLKLINFSIPASHFSSGSAPFIGSFHISRSGLSDTLNNDVSLVGLYVDNVPGGVQGNTAGYVGGNLEVTGNLSVLNNLTVSGNLLLLSTASEPPTTTTSGVKGTVIFADDYGYYAVNTNSWKRFSLSTW